MRSLLFGQVAPPSSSMPLKIQQTSAISGTGCTCQNRIFETDWRVWAVLGLNLHPAQLSERGADGDPETEGLAVPFVVPAPASGPLSVSWVRSSELQRAPASSSDGTHRIPT
ncbi:GM22443 [Drosophila sechellia]|uniref:GM22443 n=1 Tax=Drosophila sechellia TaxID=7238 RepID=B4IB03_DROSE|nr:GM22443 [Drosophila sechellia]